MEEREGMGEWLASKGPWLRAAGMLTMGLDEGETAGAPGGAREGVALWTAAVTLWLGDAVALAACVPGGTAPGEQVAATPVPEHCEAGTLSGVSVPLPIANSSTTVVMVRRMLVAPEGMARGVDAPPEPLTLAPPGPA